MGLFRQEYWSGWTFPPSGDLPNLEIESASPALVGGFFTTEPPGEDYSALKSKTILYRFLQIQKL